MDIDKNDKPSCPFCTFKVRSDSEADMYALMHHLELSHPENGKSPFIALEEEVEPFQARRPEKERATHSPALPQTPSDEDEEEDVYIECPAQCGEAVTLTELSSHMELHSAEGLVSDESSQLRSREASPHLQSERPTSRGSLGPSSQLSEPKTTHLAPPRPKHRSHSAKRNKDGFWKELLLFQGSKRPRSHKSKRHSTGPRRLGRSELGPHAYEEEMPTWLRKQIERGAKVTVENQITPNGQMIRVERIANEIPGMVQVLAQLCEQDPAVSKAFLCHPGVKHVFKMPREGGFCGYRNIQMMISFIQAARADGYHYFPGKIPSILDIQDLIEQAWDKGINAVGRIETGGIRGTRKYIGTPEAQALFCSLDIGCEANAFIKADDPRPVFETVFQSVLQYFSVGARGVTDPSQKVYQTNLPPIYFQHPGHSLTIVGFEIRKSGLMNLLVLDPMFRTSPGISRLVGTRFRTQVAEKLLKAYRRGGSYLGKYNSFEILKLNPTPPSDLPQLAIEPRGLLERNPQETPQ